MYYVVITPSGSIALTQLLNCDDDILHECETLAEAELQLDAAVEDEERIRCQCAGFDFDSICE